MPFSRRALSVSFYANHHLSDAKNHFAIRTESHKYVDVCALYLAADGQTERKRQQ